MDGITAISTVRIKTLYPGIRPLAYRVLEDVYRQTLRRMNVAQARRNTREQLEAYSKGRIKENGVWRIVDLNAIVTDAEPGASWHEYGLAIDCSWAGAYPWLENELQPIRGELWALYARMGRAHGFKAGADLILKNGKPDLPHLEFTYGMTIARAQVLAARGGLAAVWTELDSLRGVQREWVLTEVA